jgi:GNAT superfamily N-acetyltransferase
MEPSYRITRARPRDLRLLPAIELEAAAMLVGHAPESVLRETSSEQALREAQTQGLLWVALAGDSPVGFAHVERFEPGVAHLEELDVHPDHGRRGLGRRLVAAVCEWAENSGLEAVTLTTFRNVPWNMPFYATLGFEEIPLPELSPELVAVIQNETERGLDPTRRVVMRRPSGAARPGDPSVTTSVRVASND